MCGKLVVALPDRRNRLRLKRRLMDAVKEEMLSMGAFEGATED